MFFFFCNLKVLRAVLVCGIAVFGFVVGDVQVGGQVIESWKRGAGSTPSVETGSHLFAGAASPPPAEASSPVPAGNVALPLQASSLQRAGAGDRRLLAPPTRKRITAPTEGKSIPEGRARPFSMPKIESFATASSGLAIVVGLFLVCMWLLRRSGPKPTSPLPSEAVAVLGRIPLAARNFAHLLQVGNKLVLVAITPDGVAPITEVTDPVEVQRMLGVCLRNNKQSTTAEFHNVLEKLAKEPTNGFLGNDALGNDALGTNVAASYANQRR